MHNDKTELDVLVNRLDVLCSVLEEKLQPGGRATKSDLRNLYTAAQKVVAAHFRDKLEKEHG